MSLRVVEHRIILQVPSVLDCRYTYNIVHSLIQNQVRLLRVESAIATLNPFEPVTIEPGCTSGP